MKKYWYLIASLPLLRFGEKPALDAAAFRAACAGHVDEEHLLALNAILENRKPPAGPASALWNAEIQLRNAIVCLRAKKRGTDAAQFMQSFDGFSVSIEKMVTDAFTRSNPLEQEQELDRARWALADEFALNDDFGFLALLAFAVKVRIAGRWAVLDAETGRKNVEQLILASAEPQ